MKKNKFAGNVKLNKKVSTVKKNVKKILEFYYMSPEIMNAKELSLCIQAVPQEQVEVWNELNLVEVVLENDSLIFQDARECFVDPLDQEFIDSRHIQTIYKKAAWCAVIRMIFSLCLMWIPLKSCMGDKMAGSIKNG